MAFRFRRLPLVALALLWTGTDAHSAIRVVPLEEYAGSEACRECHLGKYTEWRSTLHSSVIQDPRANPEAALGDFSQPGVGFQLDEVEFTVGGHWAQRYVKRIGDRLYALPKVWSVASHEWEEQDKWSWKTKPYDVYCIGCHATRYEPQAGAYVEHTVGCEACHGPGRRHAASQGESAILNPSRLPAEEQDLICASCHVRGQDPTGTYSFAVGYVPGQPLDECYVPLRMENGEDRRSAFVRLFREWKKRLETGQPPTCDVCGINRPASKSARTEPAANCQACHRFGDLYPSHTNHPRRVELQCLDCHKKIDLPAWAPSDVHTPEYFRVHRQTAFVSKVASACRNCHADYTNDSLNRTLDSWDHSRHLTR